MVGSGREDMKRIRGEGMRQGRFDQNEFYTYMKFSTKIIIKRQ